MKHIQDNNISAISANSFQLNFEPSFMLDEHPKRLWKAGVDITTSVITAEVSYGCSDIAIFGTNAVTASVLVYDPNAMEWGKEILGSGSLGSQDEWGEEILGGGSLGSDDEWANTEINISGTVEQRSFSEALWIELNETIVRPVIAEVTLIGPGGETLHAGIMRASISEDYGVTAPEAGLNEGRQDFSIETQLQNGARYYKKRDIVRIFSGSIYMDTTEWYKLAQSYDTIGSQPTAWNLTTLPVTDWLIFGYISNLSGSHITKTIVNVNINITEVI